MRLIKLVTPCSAARRPGSPRREPTARPLVRPFPHRFGPFGFGAAAECSSPAVSVRDAPIGPSLAVPRRDRRSLPQNAWCRWPHRYLSDSNRDPPNLGGTASAGEGRHLRWGPWDGDLRVRGDQTTRNSEGDGEFRGCTAGESASTARHMGRGEAHPVRCVQNGSPGGCRRQTLRPHALSLGGVRCPVPVPHNPRGLDLGEAGAAALDSGPFDSLVGAMVWERVGPGAEAPGSVSTATLPQDAYAARRASMTTLSLAFSFWPCCPERGLLAPDEEYLPQSRIVPCRSKIKLAELLPSSRSCFAPSRSTLATPGAQRPPVILIPVRYPGQGARGGGAGHCPRVLKRYYEPVINRASVIPRVSRAVQCNPPHLDREPPEPVLELRQHRPALAIDRYVV